MRFQYREFGHLPLLSWAAIVEKGSPCVTVFHGSGVETGTDLFVEGAWDKDFGRGAFDQSCAFMGTGAKVEKGRVLFCCPSHPLERINLYVTSSRIVLSPSLVFLLSLTNNQLDLSYSHYAWDLQSAISKKKNHVCSIPASAGKVMMVHYRNIAIDSRLNVDVIHKNECEPFTDYSSYRNFLTATLSSIMANAQHKDRKIKYPPMATLSSGYDSPACAALAADAGCREAVTLRLSKEDQKMWDEGNDDSGAGIGAKLGLRVIEKDPRELFQYDHYPEAEHAATGYDDSDLVMSIFENDMSRRLVITGVHGDGIWSRIPKKTPARDIYRPDGCGCALSEYRYRAGFMHVPLPFIGCMNYPSIFGITTSEEMRPYCVGGDYDRPIPRRILEEKGVARELFGREKVGLLQFYWGSNKAGLQKKMTPKSFSSFEQYYQRHKRRRSVVDNAVNVGLYGFFKVYCHLLQKVTGRKDILKIVGCPVPEKYRRSPLRRSFIFNWGIAMIENRYDLFRPPEKIEKKKASAG